MPTKVILSAHSKKGKEILFRNGDIWVVLERRDSVPCLNGEQGLRIRTLHDHTIERWIHQNGDPNFQIISIFFEEEQGK